MPDLFGSIFSGDAASSVVVRSFFCASVRRS